MSNREILYEIALLDEADDFLARITDSEMLSLARGLLQLSINWSSWVHRRVDSFRPGTGQRGVMRSSMDCTPPFDPRLEAWSSPEPETIHYGPQQVPSSHVYESNQHETPSPYVLPLTLLKKSPLRDFSVLLSDGKPLPILGKDAASIATSSAIWLALEADGIAIINKPLTAVALYTIASENAGRAHQHAEALISTGEWNRQPAISPIPEGSLSAALLRQFASEFWLLCAFEQKDAWRRQVIKIQYHLRVEPTVRSVLDEYLTALGFKSYAFEIPMLTPYATASYHLEFHVPENLVCTLLVIPPPDDISTDGVYHDTSRDPVCHVHSTYSEPPAGSANAKVRVPLGGVWFSLACVTLAGFLTLLGAIFIPNAQQYLRTHIEYTATLFFGLALVPIGLLVVSRENALETFLFRPLRSLLVFNALLLALAGITFAGNLIAPFSHVVLTTLMVLYSVLLFIVFYPHRHDISSRMTRKPANTRLDLNNPQT